MAKRLLQAIIVNDDLREEDKLTNTDIETETENEQETDSHEDLDDTILSIKTFNILKKRRF